ncbi:hypothetical protein FH5_03271 [Priestia endophytica]|jgi:hypothetical protein|nr:hypothetical protein FH5_03271 [Priestia endophytica]
MKMEQGEEKRKEPQIFTPVEEFPTILDLINDYYGYCK